MKVDRQYRSEPSLSLSLSLLRMKIERSVQWWVGRVGAYSFAAITFPRAIVFVLPSSTVIRVLDPGTGTEYLLNTAATTA